jgi:hypothetical protein
VTNFWQYLLPHPNLRTLAPNVRFFVEHHTSGLFEQGDRQCAVGDFTHLRNWLLSHLMWNPALDENRLMDEFLTGYYGAEAAPYVKEYWNVLIDRAEQSGVFLRCFAPHTHAWLDCETIAKAEGLMRKAIDVSTDDVVKERLRRDKIPIDYVILQDYYSLRRLAGLSGQPFFGPADPQAATEDFFARCSQYNTSKYRESGGKEFDGFQRFMQDKFSAFGVTAMPDICKDLPANNWYEVQDFEFDPSDNGNWKGFIEEDAAASNGWAIHIPAHKESNIYFYDRSWQKLKPAAGDGNGNGTPEYKLYAAVRSDAKPTSNPAMSYKLTRWQPVDVIPEPFNLNPFMMYKWGNKQVVASETTVPATDISGSDYRWISLGTFDPELTQPLTLAPAEQSGDALFVDRLVVIREK